MGNGSEVWQDDNPSELLTQASHDVTEPHTHPTTYHQVDIIITTALIPGKRAPLLLTKDMIDLMRPGECAHASRVRMTSK